MRALIVLLVVTACGGAQHPKSSGMRELAAEMDAEMAEVARIVHAEAGRRQCAAMATQLRAVFARMARSIERAHTAQQDPALAKELTTEMRRYDAASQQRVAQIEQDFTVDATCAADPAVRDVLMTMPTL